MLAHFVLLWACYYIRTDEKHTRGLAGIEALPTRAMRQHLHTLIPHILLHALDTCMQSYSPWHLVQYSHMPAIRMSVLALIRRLQEAEKETSFFENQKIHFFLSNPEFKR